MNSKSSRNKAKAILMRKLVDDMYWEYDRMSSSGQETLDKIADLCGVPSNTHYDIERDEEMKNFKKSIGENK